MFVFEGIGDLFGGHMILFILVQAEQDHLAFFCYLIHGFNSFMSREAAYVKPPKAAKSTRSVPSRQGQPFRKERLKVFCPTFCILQKVGKKVAAKRQKRI